MGVGKAVRLSPTLNIYLLRVVCLATIALLLILPFTYYEDSDFIDPLSLTLHLVILIHHIGRLV
jgi:hypothetical protein